MADVTEHIRQHKLIAIMRGVPAEVVPRVAGALHQGGIRLLELPFDHKDPRQWDEVARTVGALRAAYGDGMDIGVGTVLTTEQADMAADAGARFIVSPSTDPEVIRHTKERGLISIPGAMTPSEIVAAHRAGSDFVKLFPAPHINIDYIRAVTAPLGHIPLMVFGGITPDNLADYLRAGCIGAGVGGCLLNHRWIADGDYGRITDAARDLVRIAGSI